MPPAFFNEDQTGDERHHNDEPWPPQPPDMTCSAALAACALPHIVHTPNAEIFKFKDHPTIYKSGGSQCEYELMIAAGECSITPYGRSMMRDRLGMVFTQGILMEVGIPIEPKALDSEQRKDLVSQMISIVRILHEKKRVVHGDIKLSNMLLRAADGKLCLSDFCEGRKIDDGVDLWDGMVTDHFMSPHRCRNWPDGPDPAPDPQDDLYALGLTMWQLYTGKYPFKDWYCDDIYDYVQSGKTVDVAEVEDESARKIIREHLRYGGAKV